MLLKKDSTFKRTKSVRNVAFIGQKVGNRWYSTSLSNIVCYSKIKPHYSVLSSRHPNDSLNNDGMKRKSSNISAVNVLPKTLEKDMLVGNNNIPDSIVTIVLVEAKDLPQLLEDGQTHNIFCKFRLGSENYKTKSVASTRHPEWRERFTLKLHKDHFLNISVWDKGTQKNFMGSCILDLSSLQRERTHEIWEKLEDGYGLIHLSVTICLNSSVDTTVDQSVELKNVEKTQYILCDLRSNWEVVGSLHVNIFGARGLVGKSSAYCVLELDNERVQTPKGANSDSTWNKSYVFNVYDVTSTLDLKVYGRSLTSGLLYEPIGKVSIPLLTIVNGAPRWYALKDKNKRFIAKGNCPRVRLQMTFIWNPIKASFRLFRPKPIKHVKKPKKFDIALVYSNLEFVEKTFNFLYELNEGFKRLFEWDDSESCLIALLTWLLFCFYFRLWTVPLLVLLPFIYHWFSYRYNSNKYLIMRTYSSPTNGVTKYQIKEAKSLPKKLQDIQNMTLVITNGVEYIASVVERLYNLMSFKVPFLSYLTMIILIIAALVFYFIPVNYLLMAVGMYKFARKYLNPDRALNNDVIDFISRIPDNELLKDWKELSVPEPAQEQQAGSLARSISTDVLV